MFPFNPAAGQFCCDGIVVDEPTGNTTTGPVYNIDSQVCLYGQTIGRLTPSGDVVYFCCGGIIYSMPVVKCVIPNKGDINLDMECCGMEMYSVEVYDCCANFIGKPTLS